MGVRRIQELAFPIIGVTASVVAGSANFKVGVAFFATMFVAQSAQGMRGTLSSIPLAPVDADDATSPVAVARTIRQIILVQTALLTAMSVAYAVWAIPVGPPTRMLLVAFSVAALAIGPFERLHHRLAHATATVAIGSGLLAWFISRGVPLP